MRRRFVVASLAADGDRPVNLLHYSLLPAMGRPCHARFNAKSLPRMSVDFLEAAIATLLSDLAVAVRPVLLAMEREARCLRLITQRAHRRLRGASGHHRGAGYSGNSHLVDSVSTIVFLSLDHPQDDFTASPAFCDGLERINEIVERV